VNPIAKLPIIKKIIPIAKLLKMYAVEMSSSIPPTIVISIRISYHPKGLALR
jgi:hypothetical protein